MFEKTQPKILLVEDNASNHPLFTTAFENAGFSVVICPYIDEKFIDDVVELDPDIISMDIMMGGPGIELEHGGLSAIPILKNDERTKHIPIIVLSSFFEETKVEKAKQEGAVDFINLQGHSISTIPSIFKRYLEDKDHYKPVHAIFREE